MPGSVLATRLLLGARRQLAYLSILSNLFLVYYLCLLLDAAGLWSLGLNNDQGGQANRQPGGNGAEPALAGGEWVEHTRASSKLAKNRRTAGLTNEGLGAGRLTHLLRSIRGLFPGNSQRQACGQQSVTSTVGGVIHHRWMVPKYISYVYK